MITLCICCSYKKEQLLISRPFLTTWEKNGRASKSSSDPLKQKQSTFIEIPSK